MQTGCEPCPRRRYRRRESSPERTLSAVVVLGSVLVFTALGCSDASHKLGGAECGNGHPADLVDDMEHPYPAILDRFGRSGTWYAFNDMTGSGFPNPIAPTFKLLPIDPPRSSGDGSPVSKQGARTWGSGFTVWGAGIGFDLNNKRAYDASIYTGISFWLKSNRGAGYSVRFGVADDNTSPQNPAGCISCDADFGADIPVTEDWREVVLHWRDLKQPSWAVDTLPAPDTAQLYAVKFQVGAGIDFDFTVDDVSLICTE
jgi:hypothetical protein